jgi:hypothetical protein
MIAALYLIPVAYAMARAIDAFAAYRRRTDPWRAQA